MCRTLEVYNMWNQSKIFPVVRATLAITIDKVLATHVASLKLPYPLPGSGRRAGTLACSYTEAPNHVETMHERIQEHASNER